MHTDTVNTDHLSTGGLASPVNGVTVGAQVIAIDL
jgi:hypothetical protein